MIKIQTIAACLLITALASAEAFAHGETRFSVTPLQDAPFRAGDVTIEFRVGDKKLMTNVSDRELAVSHTQKLHVFIFDEALMEFRHEHPTYADGKWTLTTRLARNGYYHLWAQGVLAAGNVEAAGTGSLSIDGGDLANPEVPNLTEVRTASVSGSVATLSSQRLVAGREAMLNLTLSRADGTAPVLTPYLGELAHVVATNDEGDMLVHVHPMASSRPNTLMIHATFAYAGNYRLWIQFIDRGVLKVVPLAVRVDQR